MTYSSPIVFRSARTALVLLFFLAVPAGAQEAVVSGAEIVELGRYELVREGKIDSPGTVIGFRSAVKSMELIEATDEIPGELGVGFGLRFRATGVPEDGIFPYLMRIHFPIPGMVNPETYTVHSYQEYVNQGQVGTALFEGFRFSHAWEIIPGEWTFIIYSRNGELLRKAFHVVPSKDQ